MAGSVYVGKTFDEAVQKGLEALRLSRAEAVITTVEEGKGGFLGLGSRPFKVSVARRPGGAIKDPSERSSGGDERRGGRRGGREERPPAREARGGKTTARAGRDEKPAAGRAERPARAGREERGGRAGREERGKAPDERRDRERQPQAATPARAGRDERPPREPRPPREEKAAREERGERASREERQPHLEPRATAGPVHETGAPGPLHGMGAPVPPEVSEAEGDDASRKRRRRGRRGGRGRRRGGADEDHEPQRVGDSAVSSNGIDTSLHPVLSEPVRSTPAVYRAPEPPAAEAWPEAVPVARASEPVALPAEREDSGAMLHESAPREHREPREAREGGGDRFRSPRHTRPGRDEGGEGSGAPDMNAEELSAASKKLTEELLGAMGFEPKVTVLVEGNRVDVTIEVDRDDDLLNGRQGETRLSLQHLLNRFLNKGDGSRYHLQLEVNDFWQQREDELSALARKLAEEAVAQNAEVVSESLNSQERRILHMTLKEDGRVKTFSLGTGMVKRVAVAPAGFPERTEDDHVS